MLEGEDKLIKRARQGEAEAFGLLYDHYCPQIYRFILMKMSRRHDTEDITHEVFLNAWQGIENYNERGFPFSSWLYRIARNKIIDHYRMHKNDVSLDNLTDDSIKLTATGINIESSFETERIKKAIGQLNDEQQDVITMRFIEELSPKEIAAIVDKSEGAVRLIQHRAINNLKIILNNERGTTI